jgi:hypothetical protein
MLKFSTTCVLSTAFFLSSCANIQLADFGSPYDGKAMSVKESDVEDRAEFQEKRLAEFKEIDAKLSLVSKAKIRRAGSYIDIDLSSPTDLKKIQNDDVIELQEGRYPSLPFVNVPKLTYIGKGQAKTVIGEPFLAMQRVRLKANDLVLSNLALSNINLANGEEGKVPMMVFNQIKAFNLFSEKKDTVNHGLYFSDIFFSSGVDQINYFYSRLYSNYRTMVYSNNDEKPDLFKDCFDYYVNICSYSSEKTPTENLYLAARENYKKNKLETLEPQVIQGAYTQLLNHIKNERVYTQNVEQTQSSEFMWLTLVEKDLGLISSGETDQLVQQYQQVASTAFSKGHYLTSSLAAGIGLNGSLGSQAANSLQSDYAKYLVMAGNKYSCNRNMTDEAYLFGRMLTERYPLFNLNGEKSDCRIDYIENVKEKTSSVVNSGVRTTTHYEETPESKNRRYEMQRIANEAKENVWKAKFAMAADRLDQAGKNAKESIARFGQVGDTTYLVYGNGNYSSKEDPLLKLSLDQAQAREQALQQQAPANPDYFTQTYKTNYYTAQNELKYESTLKADFGNGKNILIKGPFKKLYAGKNCRSGHFRNDETVGQCFDLDVDMTPQIKSYINQEILTFFEEAFFFNRLEKVIGIAQQLASSPSEADQFEAMLLYIGVSVDVDEQKFADLATKILGKKVTVKEAKTEITRQL